MPSTAVVMRPFLPKPRGHSPDLVSSSASFSIAASASLSDSALRRVSRPNATTPATRERGATEKDARSAAARFGARRV